MKPLFSIITIAFNNEEGLRRTGKSVEEQGFRDYEWLVVDGGSKDGTVDYLTTTNANWTSEPDRGIYDAMNKGLSRAQGRYLLFLNAGDTLVEPAVLSGVAEKIEKQSEPPDFVYGDYNRDINGKQTRIQARSHNTRRLGMFTCHQSMFFRREPVQRTSYSQEYKIAGDFDFVCRFLRDNRNVLYIPLVVSHFEGGGISQRYAMLGAREDRVICRKLGLSTPLGDAFIRARKLAGLTLKTISPGLFAAIRNTGGIKEMLDVPRAIDELPAENSETAATTPPALSPQER